MHRCYPKQQQNGESVLQENTTSDFLKNTTDTLTSLQQALDASTELQLSFAEQMLSLQQELQKYIPLATTPDVLHQLNNHTGALTIFSPTVVHETLSKVRDTLEKQLKENPQQLQSLGLDHFEKQQNLTLQTLHALNGNPQHPVICETHEDRRFQNDAWNTIPYFSYLKQSYLLFSDFLQNVISNIENLDPRTQVKLEFYTKQLVDSLSPSNFVLSNPDVIQETLQTKGENLQKGYQRFLEDLKNGHISMTDTSVFQVGETIATTPGEVVFRNELLELIRYAPQTPTVHKHPLLIVPAWINKFYIFDLRPQNSFVRWCLEQGIQVFIVSWVNPTKKQAQKTFSDYTLEGLYEAVKQVQLHSNTSEINALGFCAGGILLSCLMAYLQAINTPSPFNSTNIIASPIDASKSGNILAYICDSQIKILEEGLKDLGIIPGEALVHSFNLLKPKDLMWSFYVNNYLLGKDPKAFDMLYWNCDAINLPGRMHLKYLKNIFLDNKLMQHGAMKIANIPIDLSSITTPCYILGALKDHIAPWESVYPLVNLIQSQHKTFVLADSGHVAGIINPPSSNKYQHWTNDSIDPSAKEWLKNKKSHQGSWWPHWLHWMQPFLGEKIKAPVLKKGLCTAPGTYVTKKGSTPSS